MMSENMYLSLSETLKLALESVLFYFMLWCSISLCHKTIQWFSI